MILRSNSPGTVAPDKSTVPKSAVELLAAGIAAADNRQMAWAEAVSELYKEVSAIDTAANEMIARFGKRNK